MKVEQLAVSLENRYGRLAEITALLAQNGINIRAVSLADPKHFGILRLIVNDTDNARQVLLDQDFTVETTEVIVAEVTDKPGGLAAILQIVQENRLNIEDMYAFTQKSGETGLVILRFADCDAAINTLMSAGVRLLSSDELYSI